MIEPACPRKVFEGPFTNALQIHATRQIEKRGERTAFMSRFGDQFHRLHTDVLQRTQRVEDLAIFDVEHRLRSVHTWRNDLDIKRAAHLFGVDRKLVCQVQIAIHHTGHELNRMVRL